MKRSAKPNPQKLQKIVDGFNSKFPVGTPVYLKKDTGETETKVLTPATVIGFHSVVAWFEGVSGCYIIEGRVRPRV